MNLKKIEKVFTSKFVGTRPSSYEKKNLTDRGLTKVEKHCIREPFAFCDNHNEHTLWTEVHIVYVHLSTTVTPYRWQQNAVH